MPVTVRVGGSAAGDERRWRWCPSRASGVTLSARDEQSPSEEGCAAVPPFFSTPPSAICYVTWAQRNKDAQDAPEWLILDAAQTIHRRRGLVNSWSPSKSIFTPHRLRTFLPQKAFPRCAPRARFFPLVCYMATLVIVYGVATPRVGTRQRTPLGNAAESTVDVTNCNFEEKRQGRECCGEP